MNEQVTVPGSTEGQSKLKKLFMGAAILYVIILILWFIPFVSVSTVTRYSDLYDGETSYDVGQETVSMHEFTKSTVVFEIICIGVCVLAAVLTAMPLLKGIEQKKYGLVFPKIAIILSLLMRVILLAISISETGKYSDIGAKANLCFGGWFDFIAHIGLLVILFSITNMTKCYKKKG